MLDNARVKDTIYVLTYKEIPLNWGNFEFMEIFTKINFLRTF